MKVCLTINQNCTDGIDSQSHVFTPDLRLVIKNLICRHVLSAGPVQAQSCQTHLISLNHKEPKVSRIAYRSV